MEEQDYSVMVGACGWEHAGWLGRFYPDDLPEDWRLGYYSNEFPLVQVSLGRLLAAGEDELEEWQNELHDGFRFVVVLDRAVDEAAVARLQALGERVLALIVRDEQLAVPAALAGLPCLWGPRGNDSCELHLQAGRGHVWNGEGTPCWDEALALVCLQSADYQDMKRLKALLLSCAPALEDGRTLVLLFDGEPPDIELMKNARTLVELLGL